MLFIVPDDTDETLETPVPDDASAASAETARKAQLDDAETTKSTQKVDLDLDDAPFLEDEEEEEELLEEEEFQLPTETVEPKDKKSLADLLKNKFVLGGLGAVLVLGILAFFLLGDDQSESEPPPEEVEVVEEPVMEQSQEVTEEIPVEQPGEMLVKLDPFLIEMRDAEDTLRFVEISLVFSTPDPMLADNLTRETPTVRYALYYYLRSKDLAFLTDQTNMDSLKTELLSVANQYMVTGEFETLLFEQFLVK